MDGDLPDGKQTDDMEEGEENTVGGEATGRGSNENGSQVGQARILTCRLSMLCFPGQCKDGERQACQP